MKNTSFKLSSETIHPGESLTLALPLPKVFTCAPFYMPIKLIHGKELGPKLLVIAAIYGNEINGTEIIQQLLSMPILSDIKGTLIAVPVMNVHGLINRSRLLPQGIDLNRHFPGHIHGSNAERLANLFVNEIFSHADYCINLQTGPLNHYNLPMIQYYGANANNLELAKTFDAPIVINETAESGSLQKLALEHEKPFLNYVAGEAMRFNTDAIKVGIDGILNIMHKLEMITLKTETIENKSISQHANHLISISASASGTHHTNIKIGQTIEKNDLLSTIKDPFGSNDDMNLLSPDSGIIVGKNQNPLIHEGDELFQMAVFSELHKATKHISGWKQSNILNPEYDY